MAKIIEGNIKDASYPLTLHKQLSSLGHAPDLFDVEQLPGGFLLLVLEFLDPTDGWMSLEKFDDATTSPEMLQAACLGALKSLQTCLDGKAVHGDLRSPNVFISKSDDRVKVKFIDFDWGGVEGEAVYPPFMNREVERNINADPVGMNITQDHDRDLFMRSISLSPVVRRGAVRSNAIRAKAASVHPSYSKRQTLRSFK